MDFIIYKNVKRKKVILRNLRRYDIVEKRGGGNNKMGWFSDDQEFKVGDKVRVKYRGQEGYIIDKNGSLYMVSLSDGQYVDSYPAEALEKCW